ncbi:hypothetical protein RBSH_03979 [Rhodopirellula baltica SH28]|uniref:Uncharacterized protein n=1 Tax=Rhodopirellula baltica SH28 TaxID=993517 RepID=K5E4U8_RHOBT|nr:hypothetical protein RBSH_03979 [Rhodopirellula baltica SH28]
MQPLVQPLSRGTSKASCSLVVNLSSDLEEAECANVFADAVGGDCCRRHSPCDGLTVRAFRSGAWCWEPTLTRCG